MMLAFTEQQGDWRGASWRSREGWGPRRGFPWGHFKSEMSVRYPGRKIKQGDACKSLRFRREGHLLEILKIT